MHCIIYHHMGLPVCASQVDTQPTHFGGEQKHKHLLIGVEVIHQARPLTDRSGAVHAVVAVASILHGLLQDVQHLLRLSEDQGSMALLLPVIHDLQCTQLCGLVLFCFGVMKRDG